MSRIEREACFFLFTSLGALVHSEQFGPETLNRRSGSSGREASLSPRPVDEQTNPVDIFLLVPPMPAGCAANFLKQPDALIVAQGIDGEAGQLSNLLDREGCFHVRTIQLGVYSRSRGKQAFPKSSDNSQRECIMDNDPERSPRF